MQIRILLATGLLSCAAFAQDVPEEPRALPKPFATQPRKFDVVKPLVVKPLVPSTPAQPRTEEKRETAQTSKTCSIPLTNVTPPTESAKMPILTPNPGKRFTMGFVTPPAPACEDERSSKSQPTPENRP